MFICNTIIKLDITKKEGKRCMEKILLMVMIIVIGKEPPREQFHSIHM